MSDVSKDLVLAVWLKRLKKRCNLPTVQSKDVTRNAFGHASSRSAIEASDLVSCSRRS